REVSHSGATAGYRTFLARYPEAATSVAVWCNAATANAVQLGRAVAALLVPREAPERRVATPIAAEARERITGPYRAPRTDEWLSIGSVGEFARVIGPAADSLNPDGAPGAYRTTTGMKLMFTPAGAKATALRIEAPDGEVTEMVASPPPDAASITLGEYAGSYHAPELDTRLVIRLDGGRLVARLSPDETLTLVPFYRDGFRLGPATVRFVRDATGKVTGLRAFAGRARNVRYDRVP
ncbi:MAG TPA: hypothetical protein VFV33_05500, partial [Gemmatimonadaceae bacterium]|nr:hypothetical protein [Gemmatimonadaceae bacterium]